ncbi:HNH endonuclease signature motif containing protein [Salinisphaera orenii]|uniref:HNH endonuclease n=1 Tax=Salinisphaera orenii YIM 95161 TaxID=1051139 RepID=A0A423PM46_9GAMM|nr:HNH endonuclease [Salinisphaera halophila YIM 95161]
MAAWPYNTQQWQRLRRLKLSDEPLCERCRARDRVKPAKAVDHRVAISAGGDPFPTLDALASLCTSCHSIKTAEDEGRARPTIDPATGRPFGSSEWW